MGSEAALKAPAEGDVVEGRYRIVRELGRGGMGVVCAAIDVETGERWALKFLQGDGESLRRRQRFLREAEAMMAVRHPHVVRIREVCCDRPVPFLAMELIEGESLGARLRRGALSTTEAATIAAAVASAVGAAHAAGVIHRDLKPDNVLLADDGSARVVDFGIAKLPSAASEHSTGLTGTDELLGTPHYMSPEQVFGEDLDLRTDVWSLGVILYECLSGERPFRGTNVGQILKAISASSPAALDRGLTSVQPELARLLREMLSVRIGARPADMRAVVRRLSPFVPSGVPEPPEPAPSVVGRADERRAASTLEESGAMARPARPTSTRRGRVAALVVLTLAGGAVTGALMLARPWSGPRESDPTTTQSAASSSATAASIAPMSSTTDAAAPPSLVATQAPVGQATVAPTASISGAKPPGSAAPWPRPALATTATAGPSAAPIGGKKLPGGVASEMPF